MITVLLGWLLALAQAAPSPAIADQLARLEGHQVTLSPDGHAFTIDDVAGEGAARVGVVERRGSQLWLLGDDGVAHRLQGPLAIPRIAGPGYRVWVLGQTRETVIIARRLGVLAPPSR